MDPVSRLIVGVRWLAAVLAVTVLGVGNVYASGTVSKKGGGFEYGSTNAGWHASASAACAGLAAYYNGRPGATLTLTPKSNTEAMCTFSRVNTQTGAPNGDYTEGIGKRTVSPSCPSNSTETGGSCVCNDPYVPNAAQSECVSQCASKVGQSMGEGGLMVKATSRPSQVCENGCAYDVSNAYEMGGVQDGKAYHWFERSNAKGTGGSCTGVDEGGATGPNDVLQPAPTQLAPGRCPGKVNNVDVPGGVPCGTTTEVKTPTKVDSAASSASSPSGAKPGTSEQTTSTTCVGPRCSTTTTTTTNKDDGTTETKQETVEEGKADFCEKNKSSKLCDGEDDKSSWGGSCGGFTCGGDAVQCAIAREQHRRNCELFEANDASARGLAAAAAGDRPGDHPRNTVQTVSMANGFDQTNLLNGSCPADQVVQVGGGKTVVMPWSKLCEPAAMLGNVLVGITALVCLGIVFKG